MKKLIVLSMLLTACSSMESIKTVSYSTPCKAFRDDIKKETIISCVDQPDVVIPDAKDGATGPKGDIGNVGSDGANGQNGRDGSNGLNGRDGTDVTPVTMVQFCKSQGVTVYPNHFPEYGFCIGGNIFATYFDGRNAFTAMLVAGDYISTSTGLQCTFTVASNCQIIN